MANAPSPKKAKPAAKSPAARSTAAGVSAPAIDWERIELDYRAGIKTLRQIADEHGLTHGAINKRAKRDAWERDLTQKIAAKAEALVSKALVSKEVSSEAKAAERDVVEANAQAVADIRLGHRRDIQRARQLTISLLAELELQVGPESVALLADLGEMMRNPDEKGQDRLNEAYQKIITLPGRVKTMKDLGDTLKGLVAMEREAFNIPSVGSGASADEATGGKTLTDAERAVRLMHFLKGATA